MLFDIALHPLGEFFRARAQRLAKAFVALVYAPAQQFRIVTGSLPFMIAEHLHAVNGMVARQHQAQIHQIAG